MRLINLAEEIHHRYCSASFFSLSLRSVECRCGGSSEGQRPTASHPDGMSLVQGLVVGPGGIGWRSLMQGWSTQLKSEQL